MGGSESTLGSIEGYQVARVLNSSPAHIAGLLPYFDIIVGMDGLPLDSDHKTQFQQYVTKNLEKDITLSVYNLRIRALRDVVVKPTNTWGGVGVLGCSLNWEVAERCVENTWHIVDVFSNSPASGADLVAQRDYLLGMQTADDETITMFTHGDDFQDRLQRWKAHIYAGGRQKQNLTLLLLIFDSVNNTIKETLVDMGQTFSLGIDIANGYLHVVPSTAGTTKLPQIKKFYAAPEHLMSHPQPPPQPFPEAPSSASLVSNGSASAVAPGTPQQPQVHEQAGSPQQPPSPHHPEVVAQQTAPVGAPQPVVYQPPVAPVAPAVQQQQPAPQAPPAFPQPAGFAQAPFPQPGGAGFPAPAFPTPPMPQHTQ